MKEFDQKGFPYLKYWDVNNLSGSAMSQELSVNNFDWIKDTSQFNENFIKSYNDESTEGYSPEADVQSDGFHIDIAEDVETRFDTSNFELERTLPKGKYKM